MLRWTLKNRVFGGHVKFTAILLAFASLIAASAASAATMVYTLEGFGSAAIVGGQSYTGPFRLVGVGETVDLNPSPTVTAYRMDSFRIEFDGGAATAIDPVFFFTNTAPLPPAGAPKFLAGFLTFNVSLRNVIHFTDPIFATYDPATETGPEAVTLEQSLNPLLRTDIGDLTWIYPLSGGVFEATLAPGIGGIPEPATWTMLIAGFGMVGGAMRRRIKVTLNPC